MKVIIDRIEGEFLICEVDEGKFVNIPYCLYPNTKEGQTIEIDDSLVK